MSILNVFITPELALISVDTDTKLPDGSIKECSKLLLLPHIHAAVGFRGAHLMHAIANAEIMSFFGSFDGLAEAMPQIVTHSLGVARENAGALGINPEDIENFEFALVGFSQKEGRMVGHAFANSPNSPDIEVTHDFPEMAAPSLPPEDLARLGIRRADKAGMRALALDQCRFIRAQARSDFHVGGHLFVTEISRGRIVTEQDCQFPPL